MLGRLNHVAIAVKDAEKPRIHVFLATSAIHREFKLRMTAEEVARRAVEGVISTTNWTDRFINGLPQTRQKSQEAPRKKCAQSHPIERESQ